MQQKKPFWRSWWFRACLAVIALPIALLILAVFLNLQDEPLSPEAKAVLSSRPIKIPDDKNLYLAILGIDGPEGAPIHQSGRGFLTSHEEQSKAFVTDSVHRAPPDFEPANHIVAEGDFGWCNNGRVGIWKTEPAKLDHLLHSPVNQRLLDRYDSLGNYSQYRDESTPGLDEPAPFVRSDVRCLFIAREIIGLRGSEESVARAVAEIRADMDTWRRMLVASGSWLGKLIAAANIRSDLTLMVESESENPASTPAIAQMVNTNPPWTAPSDWDVSTVLTRSAQSHVQQLKQATWEIPDAESGHYVDRVVNRLEMHFYQPNATANLVCSCELLIARAGAAPIPDLQAQLASAWHQIGNETMTLSPRALYNPLGRILAGISTGNDGTLPLQLADSRVFERLAQLVIEAHSKGFGGPSLPAFMASHPELATNPMTGRAFVYDATTRTVSFEPTYERAYPMRCSLPA